MAETAAVLDVVLLFVKWQKDGPMWRAECGNIREKDVLGAFMGKYDSTIR